MMSPFGFRGPSGSHPALKSRPAWLALGGLVLVIFIAAASLALRGDSTPPSSAAAENSAGAGFMGEMDDTPATGLVGAGTTGGVSIAWALAATVLVLGLVYGALWALRFVNRQGYLGREGAGVLRLQSSVRLGSNQMLHLVQFGSQLLLVGSATGGLTVLAQMPDPMQTAGQDGFENALDAALEESR